MAFPIFSSELHWHGEQHNGGKVLHSRPTQKILTDYSTYIYSNKMLSIKSSTLFSMSFSTKTNLDFIDPESEKSVSLPKMVIMQC